MNEFEKIQAELQRIPQFGPNFDAAVNAAAAQRHSRDRSFIVYGVVSLYVGSVALVLLCLVIRGFWDGDAAHANAAELIKVAVLPVLTLVIGYYFASKTQ
jgi:hypothetical protein